MWQICLLVPQCGRSLQEFFFSDEFEGELDMHR